MGSDSEVGECGLANAKGLGQVGLRHDGGEGQHGGPAVGQLGELVFVRVLGLEEHQRAVHGTGQLWVSD